MALLEFLETFTSMFSTLDALSKKKSQRLCVNQETKRPYLKLAQNVEDVIRKEDVMEIFVNFIGVGYCGSMQRGGQDFVKVLFNSSVH